MIMTPASLLKSSLEDVWPVSHLLSPVCLMACEKCVDNSMEKKRSGYEIKRRDVDGKTLTPTKKCLFICKSLKFEKKNAVLNHDW